MKVFLKSHLSQQNLTRYWKLRTRYRQTFKYPWYANIEVTTRCNSRCKYCARLSLIESGELEEENISLDTLRDILHQFELWYPRMRKFVLRGIGEPSIYPHLKEYFEMVKAILPHTVLDMATNGIALTKETRQNLIGNLDELTISLNHYDAESYKLLNGVDKFDTVVANIIAFLEEKGNQKPRTKIQLLDTDVSRPHQKEFVAMWKNRLNSNDKVYLQLFENIGGRIEAKNFDTKPWGINRRYPCGQLWKNISITMKGDVYPCCLAGVAGKDILLGNLFETSLHDLLNGHGIASIRKAHKEHKYHLYPTCEACDLWRKTLNSFVNFNGRWF